MNKLLQAFMSLCLLGQLFFACQKHKDEVTPSSQPGYFVVSAASRPSSPNGRITQGKPDTKFDLGTLRASKEYLFMIANGGDHDIFDVTLVSDKEAFDVYPKSIQIVPGKKSTGIVPLLAVGIIHGRQLNGKGIAPILSAGVNTAVIKMKGKTISKKDTIEVSGEFTISVDAKVAGLKVLINNRELAIRPIFNAESGLPLIIGEQVTLVNSGNVSLHPVVSNYWSFGENFTHDFDLLPGETKDITSMVHQGQYGATTITFSDNGNVLTTPISRRDSETDKVTIILATN